MSKGKVFYDTAGATAIFCLVENEKRELVIRIAHLDGRGKYTGLNKNDALELAETIKELAQEMVD